MGHGPKRAGITGDPRASIGNWRRADFFDLHMPCAVFSYKIPNSNFFFRHLHEDLNLDEIKNALRLLSVNGETNLMNLIRP